jgi:nucleotide-binding universal stress UspA family protein
METQDPQSRSPILAAFSPEAAAREPLEFGLAASRVTGAPLVIVAVRHGGPLVHNRGGDVSEGDDEQTIAHLRSALSRRGLHDVDVRVFEDHTAARGLARAVDELDPELIVVGSTRRGAVGSVLLGSTAERVIHSSSCPVVVVPNGYERPDEGVQVIGAAFTPTPEGREAVHVALSLARAGRVRLRAITVLDPKHVKAQSPPPSARQRRDTTLHETGVARYQVEAEAELRDAIAEFGPDGEADIDILVNDPADGLIAASRNVDLLVMGSRGLGPKRAIVLGSVSRKVADRSACPVLIVPRGSTEKSEALIADAVAQAARR